MASLTEVEAACSQLSAAVDAMLSPQSTTQVRTEAFKYCENFKDQSPPAFGIQCGLVLSQRPEPSVRHFGLKLIEELIKLRWNDMSAQEKLFVKESAMKLMESGSADILVEANHVKDAIARTVVEISKREWPQQWPGFLTELEALCSKGTTQTELVMMVILRLVEDVAVLQTLEQTQRRKEIHQALNVEMEIIFRFLQTLLDQHYRAYRSYDDQSRHGKVCQAVLETFNAFVEWAPIAHVLANDQYLVKCFCHLLNDERLQLQAAECLLSIASWKPIKLSERIQILVLFRQDMMTPMIRAAESVEAKRDERSYVFFKKVVQVLVEMGNQLCTVWSSKKETAAAAASCPVPDNFDSYLKALLAFSRHPSVRINMCANGMWLQLCRHLDYFLDDAVASVNAWMESGMKKLVKVGQPSRNDDPGCVYSKLDFADDQEFLDFFARFRVMLLDVIATVSARTGPEVPYRMADVWLRSVLRRLVGGGSSCGETERAEALLELDAIQLVLDAVLKNSCSAVPAAAADLLKICLEFRIEEDPHVASILLSCIRSLFVVVAADPEAALMPTLDKIFKCVTFCPAVASAGRPVAAAAVKCLRKHGCHLLIKIATRYPRVLFPALDHLRRTIVDHVNANRVSRVEYINLIEAVILVSNEAKDHDAQSALIGSLVDPVCDQLRSLEPVLSDARRFVDYVGIGRGGGGVGDDDGHLNRATLSYCVHFLLAVARRTSCPTDPAEIERGRFVDPTSPSVVVVRKPGGDSCCSALRQVFLLVKALNNLWGAGTSGLLAPSCARVMDMTTFEKQCLLGKNDSRCLSSSSPPPPPPEGDCSGAEFVVVEPEESEGGCDVRRLHISLCYLFEYVHHLLAQFCINFGHAFYRQPQLAEAIVSSVLQGAPDLPDFRLRIVIRTFLKALVQKCPSSQFGVVLAPVLNLLCPYMLTRLTDGWDAVVKMRESPSFDQDDSDSAEVIADVVLCQLTRDYVEVVKCVLTGGGRDESPTSVAAAAAAANPCLSELGALVVANDGDLGQCVVRTLLSALLWPDSASSARAATLLEVAMPQLAAGDERRVSSADAAHVMFTVLSAIHQLGQHERNYVTLTNLAVRTYELLRPKHASVAEVLSQVPGCNADDMNKFDGHVMQAFGGEAAASAAPATGSKVGDRAIKAMFKKLIARFTGVDVAHRFRRDVVIKNLPTLRLLKPRQKTASLDETEGSELGLSSLFSSSKSNGVRRVAKRDEDDDDDRQQQHLLL